MKILALSQDISLLNVVDYILYKDYKIIKSTSFENLDVELSSFDLLIIDLPYWEKNSNVKNVLREHNNIPIIILTEDKSSELLSTLKNDFYVRAVLKEPLSKKELKESVKELGKKKKQKKGKDKLEVKFESYASSPIENLVNKSDVVHFRITDLQEKRIEYISTNYKNVLGISENLSNLKDITEVNDVPFISTGSPYYSIVYKIKNSSAQKIIKETGKGSFDANKYLVDIEGTLIDYTNEYLQENLLKFVKNILSNEFYNTDTKDFIVKIIHAFSQQRPNEQITLSIVFQNKDFFAEDFSTTDFLIASDIQSHEKKLGEVIFFSQNNEQDEILTSFSKILADIILAHYSTYKDIENYSSQVSKLSQDFTLVSNQLARAEAAFKDKASSYDNLNELFTSAMKDFKTLSSKFNRTVIVFETNTDGKFLSANENYYRAVASDKAGLVGKYFDDIFENSNWQNFQFEFFNNSNQEMILKQKSREGKAYHFSLHVSREAGDNGYKFVFYGKDKTEIKSNEIELSKQVTEYNSKVNELIDAKKANELLWEEMNLLKEELKTKDETIKKYEKKISRTPEKTIEDNTEYSLDKKEAEVIFKEDVKQKIEEAKEEVKDVSEEKSENEIKFKNLRGIDFKIGLKNAHNNIDTYNEILVNFENDYLDFVKDIKGMYLVNDNQYIKSRLLTLSEEAKYIGAEDLEKSAQLFHDKLADNKISNFDFELSVLGVHLNFTLESIRKYKHEYSLLEAKPKQERKGERFEERIEERIEEHIHEQVMEKTNDDSLHNIFDEEVILHEHGKEKKDIETIAETFIPEENIPVEEEIVAENKNAVIEEMHHHAENKVQTSETPFTILLNELKNSIQSSEDISIVKEKLFKLKFENSDFSKIEKLELLESYIQNGNHDSAIKTLNDLKS